MSDNYVVKEKYVKAQERINKMKQKVSKFLEDHGETVCVILGACVGGVIVGHIHGSELDRTYKEGYEDGRAKGADEFLQGLYLKAAFNGGNDNEIFKDKDGHRLGLMYETLPNKR